MKGIQNFYCQQISREASDAEFSVPQCHLIEIGKLKIKVFIDKRYVKQSNLNDDEIYVEYGWIVPLPLSHADAHKSSSSFL